jgi:hypothetical protein
MYWFWAFKSFTALIYLPYRKIYKGKYSFLYSKGINMVAKIKPLLRGMLLGVLLFAGLYGNIFIHETGHWFAADALNLNPKIHLFESPANGTISFFNQNFFTTYSAGTPHAEWLVALAGPLANLLIAIGLAVLYFKVPKQKKYTRLVIIMLMIPAILSFVSNMIPSAGSDGVRILQNWR